MNPYDDSQYQPVELGASIFADINLNMWRASDDFGFSRVAFGDLVGDTGFWDGENFVFVVCPNLAVPGSCYSLASGPFN